MLAMLDSSADSVKRAYTSFMDFAVIPFFYATWYDQSLFKDPNYFTYAYLASVGLTFAAKEISHRYKQANPDLSEDDYLSAGKLFSLSVTMRFHDNAYFRRGV